MSLVFSKFLLAAGRHAICFAYPAIAVASVLWSFEPRVSLVGGVQLTMTVAFAVFFGWRYSLDRLTLVIFGVSMTLIMLSLVHLATGIFPWPAMRANGSYNGIFHHKSPLAQQALITAMSATALLLQPASRVGRNLRMTAALGLILSILVVALSKSITNTLMLPGALGLMLLLSARHVPATFLLVAGLVAAALVALVPLGLSVGGMDFETAFLNATGKDASLTGRTLIWDVAANQFLDTPILGVGFSAFWLAPEFANAKYQVISAGSIESQAFHNFVLEVIVGTGILGILAMAALLIRSLYAAMTYLRDTAEVYASFAVVAIGILVFTALLTPSLYGQHDFALIVVTMFGVSALEDR